MLQTVWQQQHAAIEGNGQELLFPEEIANHHHGEAKVLFRQLQLFQQIAAVTLQFVARKRTGAVQIPSVVLGGDFQPLTQFQRFRDNLQMC